MRNDNDNLNSQVVALEEELFQSKQDHLNLVSQLQGFEVRMQEYAQLIEQYEFKLKDAEKRNNDLLQKMKQSRDYSNFYIARKRDPIDQHLAKFLNTYPEREQLKILFLRESEGVYQFGSRRVYIKIEKGNKIVVRVGGGFMDIEKFITQYTKSEVEKIKYRPRNLTSRFKNKLKAQMIAHRRATSQINQPIRIINRDASKSIPTTLFISRSNSHENIKRKESLEKTGKLKFNKYNNTAKRPNNQMRYPMFELGSQNESVKDFTESVVDQSQLATYQHLMSDSHLLTFNILNFSRQIQREKVLPLLTT